MDVQTRLELIKEVGEEILTEQDLLELLQTKAHPIAYDGFEPSGRIHIAQGIMRAINVNKMIKAGCKFKMWVADWHAWANNKLGGDLEKIQKCGKYLIEVWKVTGMDLKNVQFVWANDAIPDASYWKKVMQVARHSTINRVIRCGQIMGRAESEMLQASQVLYPCMQCADIFHLEVDICQLGMDQRKVNVLARELGPKLGYWAPVVVSHHMLMGLGQPPAGAESIDRKIALKMSKSIPDSAIFMTDSEQEVKRKINKAYCPPKVVYENPLMDYMRFLVFEKFKSIKIERPKKFGGDLEIHGFSELEEIYSKGQLHPTDLKNAVVFYTNKTIEPVRAHFERNSRAKKLLEQVKSFEVTR